MHCGNTNELGDVGDRPGKSFLFFLTASYPGIRLTGDRVSALAEQSVSGLSGALSTTRENPRDRSLTPLAVLITASGLQGE